MGVTIEPIVFHRDNRGSVFEPLDSEGLPGQQHVHIVVTEPSCVRGDHYHTCGTEVITVQGPALVRIRGEEEVSDTLIPEGAVTRFTIPPGVAHAIQNLGTRPTLLVAFRDRAYDPANLTWCARSSRAVSWEGHGGLSEYRLRGAAATGGVLVTAEKTGQRCAGSVHAARPTKKGNVLQHMPASREAPMRGRGGETRELCRHG